MSHFLLILLIVVLLNVYWKICCLSYNYSVIFASKLNMGHFFPHFDIKLIFQNVVTRFTTRNVVKQRLKLETELYQNLKNVLGGNCCHPICDKEFNITGKCLTFLWFSMILYFYLLMQ